MPPFSDTGFNAIPALNPGQPGYSLGSFDDHQPLCKFLINAVAITSDVATIYGTIVEGDIPAVGQLISIQGTQTGSGEFNVSDVALTGVTIAAATGIGTMTFALSASDVSKTTDAGVALIQIAEVPETIAHGGSSYQGQALAISSFTGVPNGRAITWAYQCPTAPTSSISVKLEGAVKLSDFNAGIAVTLDTETSTSGATKALQVPTEINFVRVNVDEWSSTGDFSVIAKVLV